MRAILKRLKHLERRRELETVNYDARAVLLARLNAIAERMRASPYWPPDPQPTAEELKRRLAERVASPTSSRT